MSKHHVITRHLGLTNYLDCWKAMKDFTQERQDDTLDELWVLEHPPVFTQGQRGKPEHILHADDIPIIQVDRGGQVTYHGPGQLVIYTLININRKQLNIRQLVSALEKSVIALLKDYHIDAYAKPEAPGVYVDSKKISSIGLRVRQGCAFHGLALNVMNDLSPFLGINPCGFTNLQMTRLIDLAPTLHYFTVKTALIQHLTKQLDYTNNFTITGNGYGTKDC